MREKCTAAQFQIIQDRTVTSNYTNIFDTAKSIWPRFHPPAAHARTPLSHSQQFWVDDSPTCPRFILLRNRGGLCDGDQEGSGFWLVTQSPAPPSTPPPTTPIPCRKEPGVCCITRLLQLLQSSNELSGGEREEGESEGEAGRERGERGWGEIGGRE